MLILAGCARRPVQPQPGPAPLAYLAAPSSWPPDPGRYERGLARLRACGFQLANEDCGRRRQSLFAGSDAERAADLNALCDPAVPMPDLVMLPRGGILFLEDVGEAPYRIDRMLYQLYYAGVLGRQKAVILGAFNDTGGGGADPGYTLDTVAAGFRARLGIPFFTGLPCGHIPGLATLPVGARGRLAATPEGFTLTFTGHPVLRRVPAGFLGPALTAPLP
jgi:muramoyltetrapeptide carboxypeptidase LdcA involved in peptidoglycan recycling